MDLEKERTILCHERCPRQKHEELDDEEGSDDGQGSG